MPTETETLPLIPTKLYRPRTTADLVPRPRLMQRLEERRGRPLTFVTGWLETCDCPSAWVSSDGDVVDTLPHRT